MQPYRAAKFSLTFAKQDHHGLSSVYEASLHGCLKN